MIILDPITHIYRDEKGTVIPGVTSILRDAGLIDARWFDDYSRDRGTLVHQACAMYDRDDLDMDALDPVLAPYVLGWARFRRESGFVPVLIESVVFNEQHFYAGTLDRTGDMNSFNWLLEPWTGPQTAAYSGCLNVPHKRGGVELRNDGTYKLTEYKDRNDIKVFLAALAVVNWKKNNGGIR